MPRVLPAVVGASRYLAFIGVMFGVVAAVAAFAWGGYKTVDVVVRLVQGHTDAMAVALVQIMDAFLIASGLLILSLGLYELFVGEVKLPEWLVVHDFDALKTKIAGVIILVIAVTFLEGMATHENARDILYLGAAAAAVISSLVWYSRGH
jgi:uncharacterized membrane protein YqhA